MSFQTRPIFPFFAILFPFVFAETYTDRSCQAVTLTMNSCAQRWDSIRTECTKSVTANTIWPGPCECSYYRNDLPCFDEQALCAEQVWTQVPQWFRDGVTSCLMKDASYTIRAQLGHWENPFRVEGLAGKQATVTAPGGTAITTSPRPGTINVMATATSGSSAAQNSTSTAGSPGLATSAKVGISVGVGSSVSSALLGAIFLIRRRRREANRKVKEADLDVPELHQDAKIFEIGSSWIYSQNELPGSYKPHELESPAQVVELPTRS